MAPVRLIPLALKGHNQMVLQAVSRNPRISGRRCVAAEHCCPELGGGVEQDLTVLKQSTVAPALGAADAFLPALVDKIRCRGARKAVVCSNDGWLLPEVDTAEPARTERLFIVGSLRTRSCVSRSVTSVTIRACPER